MVETGTEWGCCVQTSIKSVKADDSAVKGDSSATEEKLTPVLQL